MMRIARVLLLCCFTFLVTAFRDSPVPYLEPAPPPTTTTHDKSAEVKVVHEAAGSMCYNEGRAAECMPPFTNVAEGAAVQATSTCGWHDRTEQFCTKRMTNLGRLGVQCQPCDKADKFHAGHLTDRHQMNNETYWVSGEVAPGETVNLTLSLGKTFEVHYISLRPYGRLPDIITLYKSSDFRKTWQPWQHFSSDCYRAFRLPTSNERNAQISSANIHEVLCVALKDPGAVDSTVSHPKVIAFSTVIGRSSSHTWSPALIDWMTMTDLRISLTRFSTTPDLVQHDMGGLLLAPNGGIAGAYVFPVGDAERSKTPSSTVRLTKHPFETDPGKKGEAEPEKGVRFAFSDLAIGARCKCNGHANRCVRDRVGPHDDEWGPLRCDCQHNTAGTDCEHCSPGYLDHPWARASTESANECKRCDCNLHSNTCSFSEQLYLLSAKTSGGICQDCQHNTAGRKCHQCASGFRRDWTKPISHDHVCVECHCHSIGSIANQPCDRKTGQCPCKPGVAGLACDRCQDGYKQTNLSDQPCVRASEHFAYRRRNAAWSAPAPTNHDLASEKAPQCPPCRPHKKRVRFKNFCLREAVFLGTVKSHKQEQDKYRYEVRIQETWRLEGTAGRLLPRKAFPTLPPFPIWVGSYEGGSPNRWGQRPKCFCPTLKNGETYLFLTDSFQIPYGNRMELMLNANSFVLPWREPWRRRLNNFVRKAARGRCNTANQPERAQNDAGRFREVPQRRTGLEYYQAGHEQWASHNGDGYTSAKRRPTTITEQQAMFHRGSQPPGVGQTPPESKPSFFNYYSSYG